MNNIKKKNSQKTKTVFTKSQVEAISHRKGHLQIIACPGSGKTEAVSQRIAGMIQEDPYMANIAITGVYATVSFVRSYFLRRIFFTAYCKCVYVSDLMISLDSDSLIP